MATIVNMHEAKTRLSALVEKAERGEEVVIARNGKPAVRLVAAATAGGERRFGRHEGLFKVPADINDPLPEGFDGLA